MEPNKPGAAVEDDGGIDLGALFRELAGHAKFLSSVIAGGAILGGAIAFLIPNMYTATALILPPTKPQSLSSAMLGQLGALAGAAAPSLGLKDPADMYIGILKSRSASDDLIRRFKLRSVYEVKSLDDTRRKLSSRASFSSGKDSMIKISVEDRDPKRAADLANAYIAELTVQNDRLAVTESAQRRLFFEREVENEKNALASAENTLRETQQRTGIVEVNSQAQVVIESIAQLRAEIAMREVELQRLKMGATALNPEVVSQETALTSLRGQLTKLEAGGPHQGAGDPLVPVASVPKSGLDYLRAMRDVKYHEALFEVLAKQYEAARVDEAKEAPVIQVVDYAVPPEKKSSPHRGIIAAFCALLCGFGGLICAHRRECQKGAMLKYRAGRPKGLRDIQRSSAVKDRTGA